MGEQRWERAARPVFRDGEQAIRMYSLAVAMFLYVEGRGDQ